MKKKSILVAAGFIWIAFFLTSRLYADDGSAQKALQKAQFMLRQATSEKADLQAQVDALKLQVEKLTADIASTKSSSDQSLRATEEKYGSAIAQWKQRDTKNTDELNALKQQLKQQVDQNKTLGEKLKSQVGAFAMCYENNKKLYDINKDLLARYQNKGFGDVLSQNEPFTGVKRVEVENLVQDYQYRLDDLLIPAKGETENNNTQPTINN